MLHTGPQRLMYLQEGKISPLLCRWYSLATSTWPSRSADKISIAIEPSRDPSTRHLVSAEGNRFPATDSPSLTQLACISKRNGGKECELLLTAYFHTSKMIRRLYRQLDDSFVI